MKRDAFSHATRTEVSFLFPQDITLQTEDLLHPPNGSASTSADIDLEQILASVTAGGSPPVLTREVLDKLLAAAAAAASAKLCGGKNYQLPPPPPPVASSSLGNAKDLHSSLPNLTDATQERSSASAGEDDSPTESNCASGDGLAAPRKSNLSGRSKGGADARQLSVRFDPKQVTLICLLTI